PGAGRGGVHRPPGRLDRGPRRYGVRDPGARPRFNPRVLRDPRPDRLHGVLRTVQVRVHRPERTALEVDESADVDPRHPARVNIHTLTATATLGRQWQSLEPPEANVQSATPWFSGPSTG